MKKHLLGYVLILGLLISSPLRAFVSPDPEGHVASMDLYSYCNGDPVNGYDPDGRWGGVDDLTFMGVGAAAGLLGQGVSDLTKGQMSGFGTYWNAGISGAVGGEVTLYAGPIAGGAATALTQNYLTQINAINSGAQKSYNFGQAASKSIEGGALGAIPVPGIAGFTAGSGSFQSVKNQILTKLQNGTIGGFSLTTAGKIASVELYNSTPSVLANVPNALLETQDAATPNSSVTTLISSTGNTGQANINNFISNIVPARGDPLSAQPAKWK